MKEHQLRHQLADRLEDVGDLRSAAWRAAVETVPRHLFVLEFFRPMNADRGVMWEPVTPEIVGTDEWMRLAYENETWVTQIDGNIRPSDVEKPILNGHPTSSSTLPGLVVAMLEDLEVGDHSDVLEIGTGSGYSTALLCERLGSEHVVSIETDPDVAARAAQAIHQTGYKPTLITGDGLDGFAQRAPYDRIIATCSVRHIPTAWITQGKPGAIILTTLSGWWYASGYAKLIVGANGTASGRLLPQTYSFMPARPHMAPHVNLSDTTDVDAANPEPADIALGAEHDWTAQFITQLAAPNTQHIRKSVDGGPMIDYYVDAETGSMSSLTPQDDGTYLVREIGPAAPYSNVKKTLAEWRKIGSPGIEEFRINITPDEQTVFIPDHHSLAWQLPQ